MPLSPHRSPRWGFFNPILRALPLEFQAQVCYDKYNKNKMEDIPP